MSQTTPSSDDDAFHRRTLDAAIRIGLVLLLVMWSFNLVKPPHVG